MDIRVVFGDIVQIEVDAIVAGITSDRRARHGTDWAIKRVAEDMYHKQIPSSGLSHLDTVVATGNREAHWGQFDHVVFVVDDYHPPFDDHTPHLEKVVLAALEAADKAGMRYVALPLLRMTNALVGDPSQIKNRQLQVLKELAAGVREYQARDDPSIRTITFVIYDWSERQSERLEHERKARWLKEEFGLS